MGNLSKLDAEAVASGRSSTPPDLRQLSDTQPETTALSKNKADPSKTFKAFSLTDAPLMADAFEKCQRVAEGDRWCAFLVGSPGIGKTHLAHAALNEQGGVFWKVPDFVSWLRNFIAQGLGSEVENIVEKYGSPKFMLVLDDYGTHNATDWAEEQLYRIIDRRYEAKAPTVVTANVSMQAVDARVASRLRSGLVICEGKDWRGRS